MDITNDGTTLVLAGQFDARSTMEVRTALYEHIDGCDHDIVVDLSEVTSVDVIALRVLAAATRKAEQQGRHLKLRGCGPAVRRLLHLSHLIRVVEVERGAASA
jgi:anti-anti-sigma factor